MEAAADVDMADDGERRGLLTDNEREILLGEKEVSEKYYYVVVSRVRNKIEKLADQDLEALEEHASLADELREAICDDD